MFKGVTSANDFLIERAISIPYEYFAWNEENLFWGAIHNLNSPVFLHSFQTVPTGVEINDWQSIYDKSVTVFSYC